MSDFTEKHEGRKRPSLSELNRNLLVVRERASDVVERMTKFNASECDGNKALLKSRLQLGKHCDVGEENLVLSHAMQVWRHTRFVDGSYMASESLMVKRPQLRENSIKEETRQLDAQVQALCETVGRCREEIEEQMESARGTNRKRLRAGAAMMEEVHEYCDQMQEAMATMRQVIGLGGGRHKG